MRQKGAIPLIVIVILGLLALGGGVTYYSLSAKQPKPGTGELTPQQIQITEAQQSGEGSPRSPTLATADDLSDWQEYLNDRYHYKIKYPKDWHFVKEGYSPPPPTTLVFSSIDNHISIEISVDQSLGRTLGNYEEIASLKSQYYQETKIIVGAEPAVRLSVPDPNSSEPISVYIQHKNYIYRIGWRDNSDEFVPNRKLLAKILKTFTFTD